jgi:hypothetical protein
MTAPDIQASLENADEIAKLTGRDKGDIIADLLDDGKLNNSNAIKENTSALDKATEMAGKTQKLLTAIIPILILIAGSGLELGGIIDLTPAGAEDPFWEDDPNNPDNMEYWGCTDWDAENYDDYATHDDGSCYYEEDEHLLDIQNHELSLVGDNQLKVEFSLLVEGDFCCDDIELAWEIEVNGFYDDGLRRVTHHSYDEEGYIDLEQYWFDMGEGNYQARVEVQWMNEMWDEETTNGVTIEDQEPEENCTGSFYGNEVKLELYNNTTDMQIYWDADWSCDEQVYVEIDVNIKWSSNQTSYYYSYAGYNTTSDEADRKVFTKPNVPSGEYDVCLVFWVETDDGWRLDTEWNATEIKIQ